MTRRKLKARLRNALHGTAEVILAALMFLGFIALALVALCI